MDSVAQQAQLRELLGDCVHCGFCLPACPTYSLWGEEMDSPRGRIHLVGQVLSGRAVEGPVARHIDACLSCMACVTACPSGVRYDEIVEAAREEVEAKAKRPWPERLARGLVLNLFPYPRRLRAARLVLAATEHSGLRSLLRGPTVASRTPAFLRTMESLAPQLSRTEHLAKRTATTEPRRGVVGLLTGCVQSVFFSGTNAATVRVLAAEGFDVVAPGGQSCCGALHWHAGRRAQASRLARKTIDAFERAGTELVVVNAAGCGSTVKDYPKLLSGDAAYSAKARRLAENTRDLSELLASYGTRAPRYPVDAHVAFHDACHLAHAQGVRSQPRSLLGEVPGLRLSEVPDEFCCGSAGIYNLVQPRAGTELADRKARAVAATGAEVVVSTNQGCLVQIQSALNRAGVPVRTAHIADVLDLSVRGGGQL